MIGAPIRWPRPTRLERPLELPTAKMANGMQALGLGTVGALLEHLPSDSREARTVAALRAGEQATVAVQVLSIAMRAVRRRGMRPLVEATGGATALEKMANRRHGGGGRFRKPPEK